MPVLSDASSTVVIVLEALLAGVFSGENDDTPEAASGEHGMVHLTSLLTSSPKCTGRAPRPAGRTR
jgi:hypothetical protein